MKFSQIYGCNGSVNSVMYKLDRIFIKKSFKSRKLTIIDIGYRSVAGQGYIYMDCRVSRLSDPCMGRTSLPDGGMTNTM